MAKKKRKVKIGRIIILLLLIVTLCVFGYMAFDKMNSKTKKSGKVKSISSIKGYGYTLREDATDYYKSLFKKLDKVLKKDNVDKDKYASLVAQMFISDFFNLDNKISKNDVGGKQFVYKEYQDDFEKYAMDSMYKHVQSNVYGNRHQVLPVVTKVDVEKLDSEVYKYGDSSDENAYKFNFEITYKDDLDYQNSGTLILIHNDKKIEVASMSESSN